MRNDMAKVVTERPRRGSSEPSRKWGRRLTKDEIPRDFLENERYRYDDPDPDKGYDYDYGPLRTGRWRRQYGSDSKDFSDLLGPLRGYLRKHVGRPWNAVWSELSAHLDKRSVTGSHIFDHIKQEVEQHCWLAVNGKVYYRRRYSRAETEVTGLYVHPMTHLLCYRPEKSWRSKGGARRAKFVERLRKFPEVSLGDWVEQGRYRIQDDWTVWEKGTGGWFILTYREQDPQTIVKVERVGDRHLTALHMARKYNSPIEVARLEVLCADDTPIITYCGPGHKELVRRRQASRKEIKAVRTLLEAPPW
jgi:hypothetical protein